MKKHFTISWFSHIDLKTDNWIKTDDNNDNWYLIDNIKPLASSMNKIVAEHIKIILSSSFVSTSG